MQLTLSRSRSDDNDMVTVLYFEHVVQHLAWKLYGGPTEYWKMYAPPLPQLLLRPLIVA